MELNRNKKVKIFLSEFEKIVDEDFIKEIIEKFKEIDIKRGYGPTFKSH